MIKFEKIKKGMILFDVRRAKWPSANKWSTWTVRVIQVDPATRSVLASWNGNPAEWMSERQITKYRARRPKEPK